MSAQKTHERVRSLIENKLKRDHDLKPGSDFTIVGEMKSGKCIITIDFKKNRSREITSTVEGLATQLGFELKIAA